MTKSLCVCQRAQRRDRGPDHRCLQPPREVQEQIKTGEGTVLPASAQCSKGSPSKSLSRLPSSPHQLLAKRTQLYCSAGLTPALPRYSWGHPQPRSLQECKSRRAQYRALGRGSPFAGGHAHRITLRGKGYCPQAQVQHQANRLSPGLPALTAGFTRLHHATRGPGVGARTCGAWGLRLQ